MSSEATVPAGAGDVAAPLSEAGTSIPIPAAPLAAGARLKAAREAAGMSVADVAQRLKYSARQVQALEDGNIDALPGLTFQRGFVRGYAKLLALDANELVASLESQSIADGGPSTLQLQQVAYTASAMPATASNNAAWPWVLGMLLAVGGIGGYALYDWEVPAAVKRSDASGSAGSTAPAIVVTPANATASGMPSAVAAPAQVASANDAAGGGVAIKINNGERPIPLPQSIVEVIAPGASSGQLITPSLATSGKLRLVFGAESWTEVRQANGEVVYAGTAGRGAERWADGQPPFDLVIGNARDVKLFYRGQEVSLEPYIKVSVARLQLK